MLALLMLFALQLAAQIDTGRIVGTVQDQSKAVVPNAKVTLTNEGTGLVLTTTSGGTGMYVFTALRIGTYNLAVELPGFQRFFRAGLPVHVQQDLTVDVVLTPGQVMETTTVTAAAPVLQAESAALGQTVGGRLINDLPVLSRDWTALVQLSAGVVPGSNQGFSANGVTFLQNSFRLNGINNNLEMYTSFAAIIPPPEAVEEFKAQTGNYSAEFGHSAGAVVNASLKSGTNTFHGQLWEYLRNDKLTVTQFFDNARGVKKGAYRRNQFGGWTGGPVLIPKLYNGRNRTFFFFDYQGTRERVASQRLGTVPTPAMVQSGFTNLQDLITYQSGTRTDALGRVFPLGTVFDPATTRPITAGSVDPITGLSAAQNGLVRDPFFTGGLVGLTNFTSPGAKSMLNILPAGRLDPNAIKLLGLYPAANLAGFTNDFTYTPTTPTTVNQFDLKIDQNFSSNDQLFGVFNWSHSLSRPANRLPGIAEGQAYGTGVSDQPHKAIALSYTHMFSPTTLNEARFGYSRAIDNLLSSERDQMGIPASFGIPSIPQISGNGGLPAISISGLTGLGIAGWMPTFRIVQSGEFSENFTKVVNSHTMKAGFIINRIRGGIIQPPYSRGRFNFSGTYTSVANVGGGGTGIAQLLLNPIPATVANGFDFVGGADQVGASNWANTDYMRYYSGLYLQDDWKVTPKLTLNIGLRWDYFTPPREVFGAAGNLLQGAPGQGGTYLIPQRRCKDPLSPSFTALAQKDGISIKCSDNAALSHAQRTNFAPRLGFAYRVTSRFVVRAAYGVSHGALDNIGFGVTLGNNYPFLYTYAFNAPDTAHPLRFQDGSVATLGRGLTSVSLSPSSLNAQGLGFNGRTYEFKTPYYQSLNFTTQYQLTANQSFQLRWLSTLGRHLDNFPGLNVPSIMLPPSVNPQQYVPFPDFGRAGGFQDTAATSNYHALQAEFERRFSAGLTILGNYSYGQCRSDFRSADGNTLGGYRAPYLAGFGIHGDFGLCVADVRHVLHAAGIYELPIGKGKSMLAGGGKLVQAVVGGWRLSYVLTLRGGMPFNVGCPVGTSSGFGCLALMVPGQGVYTGGHTVEHWLNAAAFAQPPVATTIGQTDLSPLGGAPTQARGPGVRDLDLSLFKQFTLTERIRLEFRAEAYNTSNTPQFGTPGSLDFTNKQLFSQITSASNARQIQLAVRMVW